MSAAMIINFRVEKNAPLITRQAVTLLMKGDNAANIIQVEMLDEGKPVILDGYGAALYLRRMDGIIVRNPGTVAGNMVTVPLDESSYNMSGNYSAILRITGPQSEKRTILRMTGFIESDGEGTIIDPSGSIPSYDDLARITQELEEALKEAEAATGKANAAAATATSAAGNATTAAGSANAAASAVNNATVTKVNTLDNTQNATASVAVQDGAWRFTFGLPRGLTGPAGGEGNTVPMTAQELESKSASELAALYTSGTRWLQVINNDTVVCLALKADGSTEFQSTNMPTKNLIDNPDFSNAVNQRKATSIIGGVYGLDRWQGASSITNVAITSAYLQFAVPSSSSYNLIWQKFELGTFEGKTLTLAVCDTNGTWYAGTSVFPGAGNAQSVSSAKNGIFLSFDARYGYDGVIIGTSYIATSPIRIQKVMMIEGSYTVKMLPPFVSPNYAGELEKCQYFFIPPGNSNFGVMQVTQRGYTMMLIASRPMRVKPSIVSGDTSLSAYIDSQWAEIDATLGSVNMAGNNIFLLGRTTTWPQTSSLSNNDIVLTKNLPGLSADY